MLRKPASTLLLLLLLSVAVAPAVGQQAARLPGGFDAELLRAEVGKAREAARADDDEAAIDHLSRALQIADLPQPERAEIHSERARALLRLGRRDKALLDYHRAIRLDATVPDSWYQRGSLRSQIGEPEPALEDLSEALRLDPDLEPGYRARARVLVALGRFAEAQADIDAALRLDGQNSETHRERGRLNLMMGEHWQAFRDFTKVLQLEPELTGALLDRGRATFFLGRFAAAAADFRAAWQKEPDDPAAGLWFRVAALRSGVGDPAALAPAGGRTSAWPGPVLALLDGGLEDQELLARARDEDPAEAARREAEAQFFLAQRDLLAGQPGSAEARFRGILEGGQPAWAAHQGARAELARLAAAPAAE